MKRAAYYALPLESDPPRGGLLIWEWWISAVGPWLDATPLSPPSLARHWGIGFPREPKPRQLLKSISTQHGTPRGLLFRQMLASKILSPSLLD